MIRRPMANSLAAATHTSASTASAVHHWRRDINRPYARRSSASPAKLQQVRGCEFRVAAFDIAQGISHHLGDFEDLGPVEHAFARGGHRAVLEVAHVKKADAV